MNNSLKLLLSAAIVISASLNLQAQNHDINIVAHRGFWKCEAAGHAENSIASLREAQNNGFWGSEVDVHLTSDNVIIVNHDETINNVEIHKNPFSAFKDMKLKNGESIPTLRDYLMQVKKSETTKLVLELKVQGTKERDELLAEKSIRELKENGLFSPDRVMFISFSIYACEYIAANAPEFTNQYLSGNLSPDELKAKGINGLDYVYTTLFKKPEWIERAHELGMSVNVWTVNKKEDIQRCIDLGVDSITTNEPLLARELLGKRENVIVKDNCSDHSCCCN